MYFVEVSVNVRAMFPFQYYEVRCNTSKYRNGFVTSKVYQNRRVTVSCTLNYPAATFTVTLTDM